MVLLLRTKEEDLVVHSVPRVPREWVLLEIPTMSMMNYYEEDLDDFQQKTKTERPNLWLEQTVQSRKINGP